MIPNPPPLSRGSPASAAARPPISPSAVPPPPRPKPSENSNKRRRPMQNPTESTRFEQKPKPLHSRWDASSTS